MLESELMHNYEQYEKGNGNLNVTIGKWAETVKYAISTNDDVKLN